MFREQIQKPTKTFNFRFVLLLINGKVLHKLMPPLSYFNKTLLILLQLVVFGLGSEGPSIILSVN